MKELNRAGVVRLLLVSCLTVVCAALSGSAAAQDIPPVEYHHNSPQMVGGDPASLSISSAELIEDVSLTLLRGRHRETHQLGRIRRGQAADVTFDSPLGTHTWQAELSGTWNRNPFRLNFEFEFEVTEGLEVLVPLELVNLQERSLSLTMNRPTEQVEWTIMRDDGAIIGEGRTRFRGERPGTRLNVNWTQGEGTVLKITLRAHDTDGFWAEIELIPWSVDIPHEEIVFASGSAEIAESEQPKIEDAFGQLMQAVQRYGEFVDIQLYIAGYTDTVGSHSDNQALSERRAQSIGRAFRQRGFSAPIYYQGFGEDVLAVETPDNTDEPANRRALYIIAAQPPVPSVQIPRSNWRRLN